MTEKEKFDRIRDLFTELAPTEKTSLAVAIAIIKTVGLDKALRAIQAARPQFQTEAALIREGVNNRN